MSNSNITFKGIELTNLIEDVHFSHSHSAYFLSGGVLEKDRNVVYFDKLLEIEKKALTTDQFAQISSLNSVMNMNYQICNGGIEQYFFNRYDKYRAPMSDEDVAQVDKEKQCEMLDTLMSFAIEVFPENEEENRKLENVIRQFKEIYVENVEQFETIYSDEDEEIWNEEIEDWVINPRYEEPYEAFVGHEDELFNAENFDDRFYEINSYLELLMEGYAQYLCKSYESEQVKLDDKIQRASGKSAVLSDKDTYSIHHDIFEK